MDEPARRETAEAGDDAARRETLPAGEADAAEAPPERIGRYEVRSELGRGGVGVVYEAWDPQLERPVALKTLIAGRDASQMQIERFLREVRATAHLRHPHIVSVHDAGLSGGRFFLAMDLIRGRPLDQILEDDGKLGPRRAVELLLPVVRALGHAHAEGFVHRDVKPENILVDEEGEAFLSDFGLALDLADSLRLTQTNQSLGTPAFMPPEQLRGRALDPRVDIYAVGATLFECLSGTVPFQAESFPELMQQILVEEPPPLRSLVPNIALDLEAIVFQCLEKDPARRYATPADLAADLSRFLAGEAVQASPPSLGRRLFRRFRRHRPLVVGAVVALVGLLGGLSWALLVENESSAAVRQKGYLEKERARLLQAHRDAVQRYEREEARRAAFIAASLATSTEDQLAAYSSLLEKHPDSWEGRIARARLLRQRVHELRARGDRRGARKSALQASEDLDHALEVAWSPAPLLLFKAEILRADLKSGIAARLTYERLAKADDPALAAYARGRLSLGADPSDAAEQAEISLQARPSLTPARLLLAEALLAQGRAAAALTELHKIEGDVISEAESLRLRGGATLRTKGPQAARADALRARELDPAEPRVHALLGRLHLAAKEYAAADAVLALGRPLAPRDPELLLLSALARLHVAQDLPRAIDFASQAREEGIGVEHPLLIQVRDLALTIAKAQRITLDATVRAVLGARP